MPQRRFGSDRRELGFGEVMRLTISCPARGSEPRLWEPFESEEDAEAAYWQHRERILRLDRHPSQGYSAGRRPRGFWIFEANYDPHEGRRGWYREGDDLHTAERNELRWLVEHEQLEDWERERLLDDARSERYCPLREEILVLLAPQRPPRLSHPIGEIDVPTKPPPMPRIPAPPDSPKWPLPPQPPRK